MFKINMIFKIQDLFIRHINSYTEYNLVSYSDWALNIYIVDKIVE